MSSVERIVIGRRAWNLGVRINWTPWRREEDGVDRMRRLTDSEVRDIAVWLDSVEEDKAGPPPRGVVNLGRRWPNREDEQT